MKKYIMSEAEYNVLDKILTKSKMEDIFIVQQENENDYIWDIEEGEQLSLKDGLSQICESMEDWRECYGLTNEDLEVFNKLLEKLEIDMYFE